MQKPKATNRYFLITVIISMIAGFSLAFFIDQFINHCSKEYTWINSELACNDRSVISKAGYIETKNELIDFIEKETSEKRASKVAVFFRDLNNGPTFGINDTDNFIPASLLKLLNALTVLRLVEENPSIINDKLILNGEPQLHEQVYSPKMSVVEGGTYTMEEVLRYSLVYSDNLSDQVIFEYLTNVPTDKNLIESTYRDLGLLDPKNSLSAAVLTAKNYASIFRVLYNVSFLNKETSENILNLLSQSDFDDGLRKGVPESIAIANKFGERFIQSSGEKQLHDCGIIYYPENPYLLCVMTRGNDYHDLARIINYISAEVYKEVDSRRLN